MARVRQKTIKEEWRRKCLDVLVSAMGSATELDTPTPESTGTSEVVPKSTKYPSYVDSNWASGRWQAHW